jgi:uncharacterized SAM-binding protein YcdF (DUF218 family)
VIQRLLAFVLIIWLLGFAWFVMVMPKPADQSPTDAIVVLTGEQGRIQRGLAVLGAGKAKRMLVSGVGTHVSPRQFALAQTVPDALMRCCIDLGKQAVDTTTNAQETADWVSAGKFKSVRLVTSDWHMRRARLEMAQTIGKDVTILPDAVESEPDLANLFTEYNKLVLRQLAIWAGR